MKNSIRGGGTVFAALRGRVQSVQQPQIQGIPKSYLCGKWKIPAFQQKKTMVYFPHYFIGDTIAIPLILEKQGVRKIE